MGTFAGLFMGENAKIPKKKREEFAQRVEKVFQAGGMMEVHHVSLYGKKVPVIHMAEMHEYGMDFFYNYFEDDYWENAGFNANNGHVWSDKIGWSQFHRAVVAAYVLEEMYTDGVAVALVDGAPVESWSYVAWLNYLFEEKKHIKNFDKWKLFEAFHDLEDYDEEDIGWNDFSDDRYGFISGCEICAVRCGTAKVFHYMKKDNMTEIQRIILKAMELMVEFMTKYKEESTLDEKEQRKELMSRLYDYFAKDVCGQSNTPLDSCISYVALADAPAFAVKLIAELYDEDFWNLWDEIRAVAGRKSEELYGNDGYYVIPVSTAEIFRQSSDDMIPYWKEGGDITFSEDLLKWFEELKKRFDLLVEKGEKIESPLKKVVELMKYANEQYYNIFTFEEFFDETAENLEDIRYHAVWLLYEELLMDEQLQKAGDVIFVPEGPEHEKEGLHYLGEQPRRRLIGYWDIMDKEKKYNRARVTYRRYMALVANKPLRKIVFGF